MARTLLLVPRAHPDADHPAVLHRRLVRHQQLALRHRRDAGLGRRRVLDGGERFPIAPTILGMVLGPMLEQNFLTSMIMAEAISLGFFERPIAAGLGIFTIAIWCIPLVMAALRRGRARPADVDPRGCRLVASATSDASISPLEGEMGGNPRGGYGAGVGTCRRPSRPPLPPKPVEGRHPGRATGLARPSDPPQGGRSANQRSPGWFHAIALPPDRATLHCHGGRVLPKRAPPATFITHRGPKMAKPDLLQICPFAAPGRGVAGRGFHLPPLLRGRRQAGAAGKARSDDPFRRHRRPPWRVPGDDRGAPQSGDHFLFGVGYDAVDVTAAREHGVSVTNTPDVLNDCVAETTLALMLALCHRVPQADAYVRAGRWESEEPSA